MDGFYDDIGKDALENENFRKVLYTAKHSQLVLMSLQPKEDIGMETHDNNDQFIRIEKGQGKCLIGGSEYMIKDGAAVIVPAGVAHNLINTSATDKLKLYTIYSPPHHKDGLIHTSKAEAEAEEFD